MRNRRLLALLPLISCSLVAGAHAQQPRPLPSGVRPPAAGPAATGATTYVPPWERMVLPAEGEPAIPPGSDIVLYIHGGPGSRLEESADLAPAVLAEGKRRGKGYTVIAFDQPSQGYSSGVDHTVIDSNDGKDWDNSLINPSPTRWPLVVFSEQFIVAFVDALNAVVPIENRNIYIIGGSTGGALTLRMGHRTDLPWLKKIVAWNAASVWTTYRGDVAKSAALSTGQGRWREYPPSTAVVPHGTQTGTEAPEERKSYLEGVFGPPIPTVQPNPEEWYRGGRAHYYPNLYVTGGASKDWACKWDSIGAARVETGEFYNQIHRRWHYRLGTEMLLFSFHNDGWEQGSSTSDDDPKRPPIFKSITIPTLFVAAEDDDWNEGTGLQWENRWSRMREMAPKMTNTPGYTLYVKNTGHSIHNERPGFFAREIVSFLMDPATDRERAHGPLAVRPIVDPGPDEKCDSHFGDRSEFPSIPGRLLDNPASAQKLLEPAMQGGNFSDGKSPGSYSSRLVPELRSIAAGRSAVNALAMAALYYYEDNALFGDAAADLAVTGRAAYEDFAKSRPGVAEVIAAVKANETAWARLRSMPFIPLPPVAQHLPAALDEGRLRTHAGTALARAYKVAWALRDNNVSERKQIRDSLGWLAVSGEDDPPARPVNVSTAGYPQYDLKVAVKATLPLGLPGMPGTKSTTIVGPTFEIRYMVANP